MGINSTRFNAQHISAIARSCRCVSQDTREEGCEGGGYCCVIELSKDPIANYVVNKALDNSEQDVQEKIFGIISTAREELVRIPINASTFVSKKHVIHRAIIRFSFVLGFETGQVSICQICFSKIGQAN